MTLNEQMAARKAETIASVSEDVANTMLADMNKLKVSGIIESAPKVGDKLKDFTLPNHRSEIRNLATLLADGPVVITFYRGGWCPYCNMELHAYQQFLPQIKAAGATLVAITPELPDESLTTSEKLSLEFEVLTDKNSQYAKEIGICFTIQESIRSIYNNFGIDLEKHNGKGQFDVPLPATFVLNTDGIIVYEVVEADYTIRAEPADVVAVLESLKP